MFCPVCGCAIEEDDRFCRSCGRGVADDSAPPAARLFRRDMDRRKLGGVCSGFARYFDKDATLIRIVWVGAVMFFGFGIVAYGVCWVLMPADEVERTAAAENGGPSGQAAVSE